MRADVSSALVAAYGRAADPSFGCTRMPCRSGLFGDQEVAVAHPVARELRSATDRQHPGFSAGERPHRYVLSCRSIRRIGDGRTIGAPLRIVGVSAVVGESLRRGPLDVRHPEITGVPSGAERAVDDATAVGGE